MRHCFISWSYIKDGSTRSLNEYCLALSRANHEVTMIARGDDAPYFINDNLYVVPIDAESTISEKIAHGIFFWKVIRHLRRESYDTINAFNSPGISVLPLLVGKKKAKWLIHFRTSSIGGKLVDQIKNIVLRYEARLFDRITIVDKNIAKLIGFNSKQVSHMIELPPGINPDEFTDLPDQRKALFGDMVGNKMIYIYVGKMDITRRLDRLLESFRILIERRSDVMLVMLGSGAHVPKLKELTRKTGIEDNVIFVGKVTQEDVAKYIASADIGLTYVPVTTVYDHQPPLKAMEYLQMGIPQVATATAAIKKLIVDKRNGILCSDEPVDFSNGMLLLLDESALRKDIKKRAKENLSEYYWNNICEKILIPCYEALLKNSSKTLKNN